MCNCHLSTCNSPLVVLGWGFIETSVSLVGRQTLLSQRYSAEMCWMGNSHHASSKDMRDLPGRYPSLILGLGHENLHLVRSKNKLAEGL